MQVDLAAEEQTADGRNVLNGYRPHLVALGDGIDAVDLHTHVAHGVLALESVHLDALHRRHLALGLGAHRKVHLAVGELAQHFETLLQVGLLAFQREVHVGGQGGRIERRHENRLGSVVGIGDDAVRTLLNHRPQTRFEQHLDNLRTIRLAQIELRELLVLLLGVGSHRDVENLALLTAIHGRHGTADRRSEKHAAVVLIEEQRRTDLYLVARLHQQLGSHALEIQRRNGVLARRRHFDQRLGSLSLKIDVETFP